MAVRLGGALLNNNMNTHDKLPHGDVDHPEHYNQHPNGYECIDVAEAFNFNLGNVLKYIWRAGLKGDAGTDLRKARWYLQREIERLEMVKVQGERRDSK